MTSHSKNSPYGLTTSGFGIAGPFVVNAVRRVCLNLLHQGLLMKALSSQKPPLRRPVGVGASLGKFFALDGNLTLGKRRAVAAGFDRRTTASSHAALCESLLGEAWPSIPLQLGDERRGPATAVEMADAGLDSATSRRCPVRRPLLLLSRVPRRNGRERDDERLGLSRLKPRHVLMAASTSVGTEAAASRWPRPKCRRCPPRRLALGGGIVFSASRASRPRDPGSHGPGC